MTTYKIFLYAAQPAFTRNRNTTGYLLMCCLRKYLNVRMYAEFNLHTESTLSETQDELENKFYSCLLVYNSQMTNYRVAITNLINQRPTYNLLAPQRLPHLINYNQMAHIGKRGLRA